jgi:hypothetical protein
MERKEEQQVVGGELRNGRTHGHLSSSAGESSESNNRWRLATGKILAQKASKSNINGGGE